MTDGLSARLHRLSHNVFSLAATHVRLAGLEWRDEVERVLRYLAWLAVAVVCGSIGLALLVLLVVALYWDSHRIAAMLVLAGVFVSVTVLIAIGLWHAMRTAAAPFSRLAEELEHDGRLFGASEQDGEAHDNQQGEQHE